ncbi:hypothetical protein H0H93_012742 [Arthromyces matolae]|nr:hypothetical protein H0H93_012742 [Arthromyces matolae]
MTDTTSSPSNLLGDRISFYGCLIAILAYGAMFMLYIQLAGVLLARTRRGFCYWGAVVYSTFTFPLATLAIAAIFKFSELAFVENRMFPGGPYQYYLHHSCDYVNVLGEISAAIFACFADAIMLFRLWIIWDSSWVVLAFPVLLYCGKLAVTIPVLVAIAKPPPGLSWSLHMSMARLVLSVAFNIYASFMIGLRLLMLRPRMEAVLGKLHAFYYTSVITIFVESAALKSYPVGVFLPRSIHPGR